MEKYLIDTNIVSGFLTADLPTSGVTFMKEVINAVPNISVVSEIELLSWNADEKTESIVSSFVADSRILQLSDPITKQCIAIRKKKRINTPDAIIAATALVHNYTLITNNQKDFTNIKDLKLINPHKL